MYVGSVKRKYREELQNKTDRCRRFSSNSIFTHRSVSSLCQLALFAPSPMAPKVPRRRQTDRVAERGIVRDWNPKPAWMCGEELYYEGYCSNSHVNQAVGYLLGCGTKELQKTMHELLLRRPFVALNAMDIFRRQSKEET